MTRKWSESSLPILAVFAAAFGLLAWYDLHALTGTRSVRVVHVTAASEDDEPDRVAAAPEPVASDPEVAAALSEAAAGRSREATTTLQAMVKKAPARVGAWRALGRLHLKDGESARAADEFRKAVALDSKDGSTHFELALALERSGHDDEAEAEYAAATKLAPTLFPAWYDAAMLHLEHGEAAEAESALETAVPLASAGPRRAKALTWLGVARRRQGKFKEALDAYEKAILYKPNATDARLGRGRVLLESGDAEGAAAAAQDVLTLDPENSSAHFLLGLIAAHAGRNDDARREYAEAVKLRPGFREARYNLGRAMLRGNDLAGARAIFESLHAEHPNSPEILFHLGRIAYHEGKNEEAAGWYRKAIAARKKRGYPEASVNLGLALKAAGDAAGAEEAFRAAIASRGKYPEAMYNLGLLSISPKSGAPDLSAADAWFTRATEADPSWIDAWTRRGEIAEKHGNLDEAILLYRQGLAQTPGDRDARLALSRALLRTGQAGAAAEEARAALRHDERSAPAWIALGDAEAALSRTGDAADAFRNAVRLDPENTDGWLGLGAAVSAGGDPRETIAVYREALDHDASDVRLRIALAEEERKAGDLAASEADLRRATRLQPGNARAWELLSDVVERRSGKEAARAILAAKESALRGSGAEGVR